MALKDNSPTLSYVAWSDLLITYDGTTYKIQNSYTNMKYIYWDITNPYTLQCFNKTQQQAPGMRQVFINDNGMGTQRTHEDIVMTWDGNNNDLIASQIFALHESNKVTGNKFVAIETDIEGVRQTVGETNTELGKVSERVSQIKQQADDINISVSELNKTFTDTQEVLELRENLNKSIITLNSSVGLFKSEFSSYYKNNLIDSQEQVKINTHLDVLDNNKLDLLKYIAIVETIIKEEGQTSQVIVLNSAKDQLSNSIDNIRTYTLGAISDGTIVPSEITFITNLFSKVSIAINELKNVCDDCIFLGAGGKISEELAKISIKSDEIILSVSNAEEAIKSNLGVEKNLLQGNIKDFRLGMEDLNKSIDSLSKDGVVDNTDKTIINNKILEIESEKNDIVNKYNELSTSELISPSNKSELDIEFNKFIEKYNSMVNTIHSVTTDEFFNDYEKMQVENLINETLICLSNLHPVLSQAIDNVQLNTQKKEVSEMKNELNGNIADVENKIVELNTYVNTTFEDNVLDETERKNISNNLDILTREKVDIDNQFSQLNSNKFLDGVLKTNYNTSYNNLVKLYNDIATIVDNILDKEDLINNNDRNNLSNAYLKFNDELGNFTKLSNEVINYISKKEADYIKSQLDKDISDIENKIGTLEDDINTTFKDNILDETERKDISRNLEVLEREKVDIDNQFSQLNSNEFLDGSLKINYGTSYNNLVKYYGDIVIIVNNILDKKALINDSDRSSLSNAYLKFNEELANFVKLSNEVINYISKKEAEHVKSLLDKDIEDVGSKIDTLEGDINTTFKDNILDETERKDISNNLEDLRAKKIDVDGQYNHLIDSPLLSIDLKNRFKESYDTLINIYNNLVETMEYIINKSGLINESDRTRLDKDKNDFNISIANFSKSANEVLENIGANFTESSFNQLSDKLDDLNVQVDNIMEDLRDFTADGIIDNAEKLAIEQNIKVVETEFAKNEVEYNNIYNSTNLNSSQKDALRTSFNAYKSKYQNLINIISNILSMKEFITDENRDLLNTSYSEYNYAIKDYLLVVYNSIDIINNKNIADAKTELNEDITNISNSLNNLSNTMNGVFKDGLLSDSEKLAIRQMLESIEIEKIDVDKGYESLYSNPSLIGSNKTNLYNSYNTYTTDHNSLVNTINTIVNKDSIIDETDHTNINTSLGRYKNSLSEYKKAYNLAVDSVSSKNISDAKTELNKDITDISNSLNGLESTMNGVFKDGLLSDSEKLAIKQTLEAIEIEKIDIDRGYESIYNNSNLIGNDKTNLYNAYGKYVVDHNSLIDVINEILNKNSILNESDQSNIATSLVKYKNSLSEYKVRYNLAVDSISNKNIADAKTEMQNNINEVSSALNGLEDTMNGVFKDGLLSDSEKLAIKQNLQIISKEKTDVDEQYLSIYNNVDLIGDAKTNFKLVYDSYCTAYTDVVSVIDGILNKVGLIDSSDKDLLDSKFKNYSNCSGDYSKAVNDAIDNISNTKAARTEEEAKKFTEAQIKIVNDAISLKVSKSEIDETIDSKIDLAKAEIKITTDEITQQVSQKIGKDNVISTINQSAESIKINASKINLSGYVTVTNLKTSGSTTINGGNITTGTIDASLANITNINASNITSGTINTSLVKIKGSTTKKIVMGNDNYCVYDGTETDANRKIFMGFRRHSDTISVPSIILGSNGVNPNVDGAVISGGTYTTYSHYKNNDNPEGINQSYGALAFKYNAASNDICTLNMYQDGNVGLQAGSSVYLRAGKATNSTAQLVIQSDSVLSRKPFSCSSTIYSTGNITTAGALNVTGAITGNSTLSVGAITGKSTISASGQISTSSTMYASGSITSNAGIYANTDIKANRVYANQFFVASNSQQIFKHLYTNWIANGCNWDWQGHYLNGAVVGGSIIEMNTVEDDIKSLDLNDLDTIKQIKFRDITKYTGDIVEYIDISNVTNRDEITSGREVDLTKLVHLLVKEVQYLKMRMNGE